MKFAVSISLAALILAVSVKDLLYVVSFKLNQQHIAERWCVNWDKPALNCQGTCYLNTVIKDSKKQEGSSNLLERMGSSKQILVRFFSTDLALYQRELLSSSVLNPACVVLFAQHQPFPLYQPPKG